MVCRLGHNLALSLGLFDSFSPTSSRSILSSMFVCLFYEWWEEVSDSWKSFFWCTPLPLYASMRSCHPRTSAGFLEFLLLFHMATLRFSALKENPKYHRGPLLERVPCWRLQILKCNRKDTFFQDPSMWWDGFALLNIQPYVCKEQSWRFPMLKKI